jgi:hypothetical protein
MEQPMNYNKAPIETLYKGCRFRSRTEARWAIFLDGLGVKWEYEKEGYNLNGRWYLPDFFLRYDPAGEPGCGFWLEIKPNEPDDETIALLNELAKQTGHRTYLFCGQPWPGEHSVWMFDHYRSGAPAVPFYRDGVFTEVGDSLVTRIEINNSVRLDSMPGCFNPRPGILQLAFNMARRARFEHGERP